MLKTYICIVDCVLSIIEFIAVYSVVSVLLIISVDKIFKPAIGEHQDSKEHQLQGMHIEAQFTSLTTLATCSLVIYA